VSAESLHVSAVLACVAGGVYLQQHLSSAVGPASRLQTRSIWDLVVFLLNAAIFLLLGAELVTLLAAVPRGSLGGILASGAIVTAVAIVVRLLWVPLVTAASRFSAERGRRGPRPAWKPLFLVSWTSMRGVVSMATALSLPRLMADGAPLPYRTEIILIAMCVIVLTLLVQGLSLRPIVRAMHFAPEQAHHAEERLARLEAARRGAEALEDLSHEDWADARDVKELRRELRERLRMSEEEGGNFASRRRLRLGMINAERRMLIRLRNEDAISDDVLRALEFELDLEAVRTGGGGET
jgi:CPA1 family monovalent cation:H+ antiporter